MINWYLLTKNECFSTEMLHSMFHSTYSINLYISCSVELTKEHFSIVLNESGTRRVRLYYSVENTKEGHDLYDAFISRLKKGNILWLPINDINDYVTSKSPIDLGSLDPDILNEFLIGSSTRVPCFV